MGFLGFREIRGVFNTRFGLEGFDFQVWVSGLRARGCSAH